MKAKIRHREKRTKNLFLFIAAYVEEFAEGYIEDECINVK